MSNLYKSDGSIVEMFSAISTAAKARKPHGARSNLVQTHAYTNAGTETWMESGFLFRRTKSWITSFKFDYKVEITGTATAFYAFCH